MLYMNTNHLVQNQSLEGMTVIPKVETGLPTRWEVVQLTKIEEEEERGPDSGSGKGGVKTLHAAQSESPFTGWWNLL